MRIAIVCGDDALSDDWSGGCDDHGQLCDALGRDGLAVTAHQRQPSSAADSIHAPAAEPTFRTVYANVGPRTPVSQVEVLPFVGQWAAELSKQWAVDPPDVVHAFGWLGGLAAQLAARRMSLPVVQSFYGVSAMGPDGADSTTNTERARIEPILVRGATWVTGGSTAEVDALTRMRRRRTQLSVLSTGIDVAPHANAGLESNDDSTFRILQVAPNCLPCNGFDRTIAALPKLPGTELVIAQTSPADGARGRSTLALRQLAAKLGVDDRVRFVGPVGPEQLSALLQSTHVVACTPRRAPRATAALQAMASGKVVVGMAVDALTDVVINGVTGLLVSSTKPQELAPTLRALQHQSFQRDSMGSAGRSRATSRFSWNRVAMDALSIYHQALSQHLGVPRGTTGRAKFHTVA